MYIDVTIFKTKGNIFKTMSSQNMTLVTSHVIPNIFFLERNPYIKEKVHLLKIVEFSASAMLNISNFHEDLTVKLGRRSAVGKSLITFFHVVIWARNFQKTDEIESN